MLAVTVYSVEQIGSDNPILLAPTPQAGLRQTSFLDDSVSKSKAYL